MPIKATGMVTVEEKGWKTGPVEDRTGPVFRAEYAPNGCPPLGVKTSYELFRCIVGNRCEIS